MGNESNVSIEKGESGGIEQVLRPRSNQPAQSRHFRRRGLLWGDNKSNIISKDAHQLLRAFIRERWSSTVDPIRINGVISDHYNISSRLVSRHTSNAAPDVFQIFGRLSLTLSGNG